ncbi:MAG: SMC family ATPase [Lachnospiraceae bacterium]|nr:SMC family ATPase [Lachnospiraceae bacterium]
MRPIKVEFQAFGPYAGHEVVDLEAVSSKGLFLICGKTGIGKTMILDAMTFALYGKSSGNGRDDFVSMRCTNAADNTPTFVKFEFENHGDYYLFDRRLEKKRINLSPSYNLMKKDPDGIWRVMFENPKEKLLNEEAERIIGLSYGQFRQVIVLPQGQFERFLTSNSDEKEKILSSIFGEEKWKRIAELFYEEARERRDALKDIKAGIALSLEEEGCEDTAALEAKIGLNRQQAESLKEESDKAGLDEKIKEQQEILTVVRHLNGLKDALDKRIKDEEKAVKAAEDLKNAAEKAAAALKAHLDSEADNEEKKALCIRYEGKRGDYEGIDKAANDLRECEGKEKEAKQAHEAAVKKLEGFTPLIKQLKDEYEELKAEHSRLLNGYLAGITGELAQELKEGEPCPVCGSREHPDKAKLANDSVTKEQVESKKEEEDDKYDKLQDMLTKQEKAKAELNDKDTALNEAKIKVTEATARLDAMKKNLVPGMESLKELNAKINGLNKETEAYKIRKDELTKAESAGREAYGKAGAAIRAAGKEKDDAKKAYDEALKEAVKGLEKIEAVKDTEGKDAAEIPDEETVHEAINAAMDEKEEYGRKLAVLNAEIKRLENKLEAIRDKGKGIDEKVRVAEEDHAFAKRLRGDYGTSLQRYVLGVMFSSVVSAANRMLEMVHGGRYRLFRSDEKAQGSNKRGLELKVFDKNSGEHDGRFVGTLSGGEKFLVSLALSIGMSNVAARGGISMEALFIDEGFGSLDDDSIDDAMNVLNSIQEANGMVGIISHVGILQERIPNKLRVISDERGSHIIQSIG